MCPSILLPVEKFPMTPSGKLDRHAVSQTPVALSLHNQGKNQNSNDQQHLTETESKLKTIWEQVLSYNNRHLTEPIDIALSTNFFHVGGTSMLFLEIKVHIRREFGISIQLIKIFKYNTLATMARLIESRDETLDTNNEDAKYTINWEEEATLPQELECEIHGSSSSPMISLAQQKHSKVILLTGATGNLGSHILQLLLVNPFVEKVICIAVRNIDQRIASGALPCPKSYSRVVYYPGDLRRPRLGLSEQDFTLLSGEINAVVHVGADVSHAKTYETLREANVGSVRELIRLCLPR
jgi:hybrid polyketide synthase / nonribosomal peptide synthetase ACE1